MIKVSGGGLAGQTVVDVTNALAADMSLAIGFTTSSAEALLVVGNQVGVEFLHG